jgi:ribosomal protein S12 methylthiotransferase accessory factor
VTLRSSLREVDPATTLARIESITRELGVVRVTDVTRLDRYGIPVCVGVRPDAQSGSLCVTAGKGLRREDALVGAAMEAIEMAWAEHGRSRIAWLTASARMLADALVAFAPKWGQRLDLDAALPCVIAHDVRTGEQALVPAELVFHPFDVPPHWFGTSTNGLASGNTVDEASLHAVLELVERDAMSFQLAGAPSQVVALESLPEALRAVLDELRTRGLEVAVRAIPSAVELPVCSVMTFDPVVGAFAMRGDGCHLMREIAVVRALTEAMQTRLSYIHGGRDDLVAYWRPHEVGEPIGRRAIDAFAEVTAPVAFGEVASHAAPSVADGWARVLELLAHAGFRRVLRVVFTPPDYPIQVVRVIVPGLECFTGERTRVGPRLRAFRAARARR